MNLVFRNYHFKFSGTEVVTFDSLSELCRLQFDDSPSKDFKVFLLHERL